MRSDQPSGRLISWKQIAHYLQCEERTAQRWERERGLPVHRIPGDKRGSVYAFKPEIDFWLATHAQDSSNETTAQVFPETSGPTALRAKTGKPTILRLTIGVTIALILLAVGTRLARTWANSARVPSKVEFSGAKMIARSVDGQVLWTFDLPGDGTARPGEGYAENIVIQDLDGNGAPEVLAAVNVEGNSADGKRRMDELLCLTGQGELLWRYRPSETYTFGMQKYEPPWLVRGLLVTGTGPSKNIWLTVVHNPWWPSLLIKLNPQGQELTRYVNAGYIYQVVSLRNENGSFMLVGGVNNEYDSGMLAVLREDDPQGASPQTSGSAYECKDCPVGAPVRYFIFPRSELNRVTSSPYNNVHRIEVSDGRVYVLTQETSPEVGWGTASVYEFGRDLAFNRTRLADGYWDFHRKLHQDAVIKHPASRCPEWLHPSTPREWQGGSWREISSGPTNR